MFSIEPTPFDLQFHLGRIPVRVHPLFWVVAAIFGWNEDLRKTVIVMLCMFVSILIHELGHALTAEAFGWPSEILLYHFGGLAFSQRYHGNTPLKSILVSLAGPFAGFALAALVIGVHIALVVSGNKGDGIAGVNGDGEELVWYAIVTLELINIAWGIINLAPVIPLDGGQVMRSVFEWIGIRDFDYRTAQVSLIIGGLVALGFFSLGIQFTGVMFLFLAMQNFMTMQQMRRW